MAITFKKWVLGFVGFLTVFVGVNLFIWHFFTRDVLTSNNYYNGGIDRMGYIVGSKHYRSPENTLSRTFLQNKEYHGQHVDVLTIGDSFSNVINNGRDPLYQSWIASLYNLDVLNMQPINGNMLSTIIMLVNSGYLDRIKPRFIIIETVERHCISLYYKQIDLKGNMPYKAIDEHFLTAETRSSDPKRSFINTGNFMFLINSVLYKYSNNAFFSDVYAMDLNAPLFSVKNERRLLFYKEDLHYLPLASKENVRALNDTLNGVAELLRKKNITLYFMPAADKYNIYTDYIVNNPYPQSTFFELLRPLPKKYTFVDTKAILSQAVKEGEKDIYYADDTHWSWKASKLIAESMRFKGRI